MNRENFKTILLFNLVVISVFLSYNLWTYQARFSLPESSSSLENVSLANQRNVTDVVKPSYVVYHTNGGHYMSGQEAEVELVTGILESGIIEDVTNLSEEMSIEEIQNLVTNDEQLEIVYPSSLSLNVLKKLYKIDDSKYGDVQVNRIVINIDNQDKESATIYFVSLKEGKVLEATLSNVSYQSLSNIAQELSSRLSEAIKYPLDNNEIIYLPKEPVTVRKIDLLAEYISTESFQQALFSTTNYLNTETEDTVSSYTDGIRLLTIDTSTGNLFYLDPSIAEENLLSGSELIGKSVEFVNGHDGWTNAYHLDSWNEGKGEVLFRMVEDGLPIFGGGTIMQRWGDEKIISYERSSYKFDDSLQLSQLEVTLPSGQEVIEAIENIETINQAHVQNIMIAYKMQFVEGATTEFAEKLLQLIPIWCIQYNGAYYELILEEGGGIGGELHGLE